MKRSWPVTLRRGFGVTLVLVLVTVMVSSLMVWAPPVAAAVTLNTNDPGASGFEQEGTEAFTVGPVMVLTDGSIGSFISFSASDIDAMPGQEVDVIATFQVKRPLPGHTMTVRNENRKLRSNPAK